LKRKKEEIKGRKGDTIFKNKENTRKIGDG
jgi:hypothetical protein